MVRLRSLRCPRVGLRLGPDFEAGVGGQSGTLAHEPERLPAALALPPPAGSRRKPSLPETCQAHRTLHQQTNEQK